MTVEEKLPVLILSILYFKNSYPVTLHAVKSKWQIPLKQPNIFCLG